MSGGRPPATLLLAWAVVVITGGTPHTLALLCFFRCYRCCCFRNDYCCCCCCSEYTKDVAPLFASNSKQAEEGGDGSGGGDGSFRGSGGIDEEEAAVVGGSDAALSRSILRQHAAAASVNDGPEVSFLFGTEGASLTMRDVIYKTFDDPTFSPLAKTLAVILVTAVFLAIITFVLQTEPSFDGFAPYFAATEGFCVTVFLVDYGTRLATCPSLKRFLFSAANTLDLLTILPYFLDEVNEAFHPKGGFGGAVRILRVFRIFRIFRVTKYIPYVNLMVSGGHASSPQPPSSIAISVLRRYH